MANLDHRLIQAHDYALINPLQVDPDLWADMDTLAVVPTQFKAQSHLFPRLVDLNRLELRRRVALIEQSQAWQRSHEEPMLSALLHTTEKAQQVVRHLALRMHVKLDGRDRVFRFYDPRVFRHLSWLLEPAQMRGLLGPVRAWTWCMPDGGWHSCESQEAVAESWRLRPDQWAFVARMEDINQSIEALCEYESGFVIDEKFVRRLDAKLVEAEQIYGMLLPSDRRFYAEHSFRFHPYLHQHPILQAALDAVRSGKISYVGACAGLDEATLQQFAVEIDSDHRDRS